MALSEQTVIDKIDVLEDGTLQIRTATRVLRDGVQIAETYHRETATPGQDVSGKPEKVRAIAAAAWPPAVVQAWQNRPMPPRP